MRARECARRPRTQRLGRLLEPLISIAGLGLVVFQFSQFYSSFNLCIFFHLSLVCIVTFSNSFPSFPVTTAIDKLRGFRSKNRVPLVEALYNGHVKPLEVYLRKKLPLFSAARSTVAPLPVCPFVAPSPSRAKEVKHKLELARNRYVGNTDKPTESNDDNHDESSSAVSGRMCVFSKYMQMAILLKAGFISISSSSSSSSFRSHLCTPKFSIYAFLFMVSVLCAV